MSNLFSSSQKQKKESTFSVDRSLQSQQEKISEWKNNPANLEDYRIASRDKMQLINKEFMDGIKKEYGVTNAVPVSKNGPKQSVPAGRTGWLSRRSENKALEKARKKYGKYWSMVGTSAMALFPVWVATGVWHGAGWKYLFYGMYYFVILLFGVAMEPIKEKNYAKMGLDPNVWWLKTLRILKTWVIIFTGELFFNAVNLKAGFHMFFSIFGNFHISSIWKYWPDAITTGDVWAICVGSVIVWIVGFMKEHGVDVRGKILNARTPYKWGVYYLIIFAILLFGAYGTGYQPVDLSYAGF